MLAKVIRSNYFDEHDQKLASSRTTPANYPDIPLGTWSIDDEFAGAYGHDVHELVEFEPLELDPNEFKWGDEGQAKWHAWDRPRAEDAERYADWLLQGLRPPPIIVVERLDGSLGVINGHRRLAAAQRVGRHVRAWVSWSVPHPEGLIDTQGGVMLVGLTYELAHGPSSKALGKF